MGVDMDFSKLSAQDVLDLAAYAEREAQEHYEELVTWMENHDNPEAARFFQGMAALELHHHDRIAARRMELFGDAEPTLTDVYAWEIETPDYDAVTAGMTLRSALETSLRAEKAAYEYYATAIEYMDDALVVALLEELRDAEVEHQRMIERQLAKL
jgi:rubrerythrin